MREAVSDAIDLLDKYKVGKYLNKRFSNGDYCWSIGVAHTSKQGLLDQLFPVKTPQQLEIKKVELKMRVLADRLKTLNDKG